MSQSKNLIFSSITSISRLTAGDALFYLSRFVFGALRARWFANSNNLINSIAFIESGWKQSQTIMWLKESHVVSRSQDYHHAYEPCMFGWKKGKAHYKDKKVKNYNDKDGDIIVDGFGGIGG